MAEAAGGDALAWQAAEHIFAAAIEQRCRNAPSTRDGFHYRGPHRGEWLRASALQWDEAGAVAARAMRSPVELAPGKRFDIAWNSQTIWRVAAQAAIPLCHRRGLHFTFTEPGYSLAMSNGFTMRSHYREFRTQAGADAFFPKLAKREFDIGEQA